jgi:hypothetical protein
LGNLTTCGLTDPMQAGNGTEEIPSAA